MKIIPDSFLSNALNLQRLLSKAVPKRSGSDLAELASLDIRLTQELHAPRINLMLVGAKRVFGGIETAVRFFNALVPSFPRSRVIVIQASQFDNAT